MTLQPEAGTGDTHVDEAVAALGTLRNVLTGDRQGPDDQTSVDVDKALAVLTAAHQKMADRLSGLG